MYTLFKIKSLVILLCLVLYSCIDTSDNKETNVVEQVSEDYPREMSPEEYIEWLSYDEGPLYKRFKDSLSIEQLREKLHEKNPYHRINAFYVLLALKDSTLNQYVISHLNDTVKVDVISDDVQWESYVIDAILNKYIQSDTPSKNDKIMLRDTLFSGFTHLGSFSFLLKYLKPEDKFYKNVRKLAQENHSESAFIALSKYKMKEDIPILVGAYGFFNPYRGDYFKIIRSFPDKKFVPILENHFRTKFLIDKDPSSYSYSEYIHSLATIGNTKCVAILDSLSNDRYYESKHDQSDFKSEVLKAIYRNPKPQFKGLKSQLERQLSKEEIKFIKEYLEEDRENPWY